MQLWLLLAGSVAALCGIFIACALRVELDARAIGETSGAWVCAFGIELAGVAISGSRASGGPLRLELHALGRRFPLPTRRAKEKRKEPGLQSKTAAHEAQSKREPGGRARWFGLGPWQIAEFVLGERRRIVVDRLSLDLDYGFKDIALTGRLAGVLYALAGALPRPVTLRQQPRWDGSERWELSLSGQIVLWPGLVLAELVWYMLRERFRAHREPAQSKGTSPSPGSSP